MRKFSKLSPLLTILALVTGGSVANAAGDTGKGGVSCTFQKCMSNCKAASGIQCAGYCDKMMIQRRTDGTCKK